MVPMKITGGGGGGGGGGSRAAAADMGADADADVEPNASSAAKRPLEPTAGTLFATLIFFVAFIFVASDTAVARLFFGTIAVSSSSSSSSSSSFIFFSNVFVFAIFVFFFFFFFFGERSATRYREPSIIPVQFQIEAIEDTSVG